MEKSLKQRQQAEKYIEYICIPNDDDDDDTKSYTHSFFSKTGKYVKKIREVRISHLTG